MDRIKKMPTGIGLLGAAALMLLAALPAHAQDTVADFYRGKQIRFLVGGGPGGGYDIYSRTFARYFGNRIPGQPTVVVENMQGAASLRLANYLYNVALKDGSVMGMVEDAITTLPLFKSEGVQYDTTKFNWLGNLNNEVSLCVSWHDSPVKTIDDALHKELLVGGAGANDTETFPKVLNQLIGTKFKIVSGYVGANLDLAMEQREIDGRCGWSLTSMKAQKPEWLRDKKLNLLVQLSLVKLPELADVPLVMDYAHNDRDRQILALVFAPLSVGRPLVAPPGVPPDRIASLRKAFLEAAKDPAFVADIEKAKLEVDAMSGEDVQALVTKLAATPPDIAREAAQAMDHK
jgi:tripartite-type tricarboxylate transporter receptor subunit TctC